MKRMSKKEWEKAKRICELYRIPLKITTIQDLLEHERRKHPDWNEETLKRRAKSLYYSPYGYVEFTFSRPTLYLTPYASWGTFLHELGHAVEEAEEGEAFTIGRELAKRAMKVINKVIGASG